MRLGGLFGFIGLRVDLLGLGKGRLSTAVTFCISSRGNVLLGSEEIRFEKGHGGAFAPSPDGARPPKTPSRPLFNAGDLAILRCVDGDREVLGLGFRV